MTLKITLTWRDRQRRNVRTAPRIAERVRQLPKNAGLKGGGNDRRGYDQGFFIPLKVAFPHADVPVVRPSMQSEAWIGRLAWRLAVLLNHCASKACLSS